MKNRKNQSSNPFKKNFTCHEFHYFTFEEKKETHDLSNDIHTYI